MRSLIWLKYDLRLIDNALFSAVAADQECLPVYCLDPQLFTQSADGFRRCGARRTAFLLASLADLRRQLQALGSDLLVVVGAPASRLPALCSKLDVLRLLTHDEPGPDERRQIEQVRHALPEATSLHLFDGNALFDLADLPFDLQAMPGVFTGFRNRVEKRPPPVHWLAAPESLPPLPAAALALLEPLPELADLGLPTPPADTRSALPGRGGESAALAWLQDYLWQRKAVRHYKETRNQLLGHDYSSKLSPWLAHGCLSPRLVVHELRTHEERLGANDSTYWLWFELLWREFFRLSLRLHGNAFFRHGGLHGGRPPRGNGQGFQDWRDGCTGQPFVDACMNELNSTGFLSNRGRQIAASYLIHDLQQDWRLGAAWFEQQLIDYDVASNWGNWAYIAGVGHDPRGGRAFNVAMQAERYDADGRYVATWASLP